ncbi:amino acid permease [Mycolicibacterium sp. 120266]|uniref:APC family permease n=1 Tax=Mycolicibacterium sp. 120266 TaxID=3090601 RepID=UPI00299EB87C|nr:amino acid permease [Mycolicibacterium sp. 120266]MDX1876149.1 amino acid permease [Mycolicibacterium sp. 120266]
MAGYDHREDDQLLAKLGYRQELTRSLGQFSTFATGFAFISILTGMFLLFGFTYASGGPASIWAWIVAIGGQLLFALVFAELAVKYPLTGSVYNWSKHIAKTGVAWMAGSAMILALVVSSAAVALTMQAILPSISDVFWIYGDGSGPNDASINSVMLGSLMLVGTTVVMLCGTRVRALINNIGVTVELVASLALIVLLIFHAKRGPAVVFQTNGTESNYSTGYTGALMLCLLLGLIVMWGFDSATTLSEETINPRKNGPKAIIRALLASGIFGALLILGAVMAVEDLGAEDIASGGLAYVITSTLGNAVGDIFLVCGALAVFVCGMANQTGAVNLMFAMARDNAFPGSKFVSKVNERVKVPVVPTIGVALIAILILLFNMGQPQIFLVVSGTTIILALTSYLLIVAPNALQRLRGQWTQPEKGYFNLGRLGTPIAVAATVWAIVMIVNIAWPRPVLYNPAEPFHWYLRWGGVLAPAIMLGLAFAVYWTTRRGKIGILAEHAAEAERTPELGGESAAALS